MSFAPRDNLIKKSVPKNFWTILALYFLGALAVHADAFQLADGTSFNGDIVTFNDTGVTFRLSGDTYTNVMWSKLSQDTLKQLTQNPKIKPIVEPLIEIPESARPAKPEVQIQEVQRLELPPKQSLLAALFSSSVGIVVLLLIYAANLYAGFEIAVVRSKPIALVMGISAVLPVLGPVIFLSIPGKKETPPPIEDAATKADPEKFAMPGAPPKDEIHIAGGSWQQAPPSTVAAPVTQVFQRGQYMFNRRFFETKFSGFFGAERGGAEKNLTMLVKATKGEFVVESIVRLGLNEIYFEAVLDDVRQEIMVPFADIREIQLKPPTA